MSHKNYESLEYIAQCVANSLKEVFKDKIGFKEAISIKHSSNNLYYSSSKHNIHIDFFKEGKNYFMRQETKSKLSGFDSIEGDFFTEKLDLSKKNRSKLGKISPRYSKSLAEKSYLTALSFDNPKR